MELFGYSVFKKVSNLMRWEDIFQMMGIYFLGGKLAHNAESYSTFIIII